MTQYFFVKLQSEFWQFPTVTVSVHQTFLCFVSYVGCQHDAARICCRALRDVVLILLVAVLCREFDFNGL